MEIDAIGLLLILIGVVVVVTVLILFDAIKVGKRAPGLYQGPRVSRTRLISTRYGEDTILGGDTRYGKTITLLQNTGRVQDIIPGINCFPLHERTHMFGDMAVWVHLDENYTNDTVRKIFEAGISSSQRRRMTQLLAENKALRFESEKLRTSAKQIMMENAQVIGTMQRSTSPFMPSSKMLREMNKNKSSDDDD